MKGWELSYEENVLNEALECKVEIVSIDDNEIIAWVDDFKVECPIVFKTPLNLSCSCGSKYSCKHQAGLMYYIEKHPEILQSSERVSELVNMIEENQLKEFLISQINQNSELKNNFLAKFGKNPLDKDYYWAKLDRVFRSGEDRDFAIHEIYNLDMMALGLSEFMEEEIEGLLKAAEHAFAAELMEKIAELLGDELSASHDSWYDLAEEFMEYYYIVLDSIYLTENERESLENSADNIRGYL